MAAPKKKLAKKPSGGGSLIGMRTRIRRVAGSGKKKAPAEGKTPFTWQRLAVIVIAIAIGAVIAFGMSKR